MSMSGKLKKEFGWSKSKADALVPTYVSLDLHSFTKWSLCIVSIFFMMLNAADTDGYLNFETPSPFNNQSDSSMSFPFDTTPRPRSKYLELVTSTTMFGRNGSTTVEKEHAILQNYSVFSE